MGIYDSPELSTKAKTPKKPTPSKKMKPCKECGKPVMTFTKKCPFCNCMKPGLPAYLVPITAIYSLLSTELGGGGGDISVPSIGGGGVSAPQPVVPAAPAQVTSTTPTIQAYVVSGDVRDGQEADARLRNRRTV